MKETIDPYDGNRHQHPECHNMPLDLFGTIWAFQTLTRPSQKAESESHWSHAHNEVYQCSDYLALCLSHLHLDLKGLPIASAGHITCYLSPPCHNMNMEGCGLLTCVQHCSRSEGCSLNVIIKLLQAMYLMTVSSFDWPLWHQEFLPWAVSRIWILFL